MVDEAVDHARAAAAARPRARRLRALLRATDVLLVALAVTVVWLIHAWWSWWFAVLAILAFGFGGKSILRLRPRLAVASQRAHAAWLLHRAYLDERPPILLLRSFRSATAVAPNPTIRLFGRESPVNQETSIAAARSFVLDIASEVRDLGFVVAIGFSQRGHAAAARFDVLYLSPNDDDWFELFELLSASARAVVMLPGETESVLREHASLRARKLSSKVLMLMPPVDRVARRRFAPWHQTHSDDVERGWAETSRRFAEDGIQLPPYDPQGNVFLIDDDGAVTRTISLEGYFLRVDRAIESLVPDPGAGVTAMRDLMPRLGRFDLPELR